jgi:hypothetical protein
MAMVKRKYVVADSTSTALALKQRAVKPRVDTATVEAGSQITLPIRNQPLKLQHESLPGEDNPLELVGHFEDEYEAIQGAKEALAEDGDGFPNEIKDEDFWSYPDLEY